MAKANPCHYCGKESKHKLSNGKYCCEKTYQACISKRNSHKYTNHRYQENCPYCNESILKTNISEHLKVCPKRPVEDIKNAESNHQLAQNTNKKPNKCRNCEIEIADVEGLYYCSYRCNVLHAKRFKALLWLVGSEPGISEHGSVKCVVRDGMELLHPDHICDSCGKPHDNLDLYYVDGNKKNAVRENVLFACHECIKIMRKNKIKEDLEKTNNVKETTPPRKPMTKYVPPPIIFGAGLKGKHLY